MRGKSVFSVAVVLAAGLVTGPSPATAAPATFAHPGVLVSKGQLDFVRAKVNEGAQPWKAAYDQMMAHPFASLSRTPKPRAVVECGSYSNPNYGCTDEREDALAAYTLSLAWYITRDSRYATKAIQIMDAWSAVIQDHTNTNAPLQTAWAGSSWPRAAEIIKHVYGNWPNASRFATMLRNVYLPEIANGRPATNGNWELSMMEASLGIAVFLEDRAAYDKAVSIYRTRMPAYVYLTTDGDLPKPPPNSGIDTRAEIISYWQGQSTFVNGLSQETCRDFTHTGYGLAAAAHLAETARHQGQDLWSEVRERLRHAYGLHAKYQLGVEPVPSWLCGGTIKQALGPTTEVAFNALHTRLGIGMTNTQRLTEQQRPAGTDKLFIAWETLTHAANPS
ncbi:alginate lyase family protein [Saccharothrix variisporea]|uniref:alginate lyase family protein n=1 Tax=Saccharothrix variisporea TaxID=543527 RepID=UPI000EB0AC37|nr:alginate lyase family protein [Saccharothrix variisporea]